MEEEQNKIITELLRIINGKLKDIEVVLLHMDLALSDIAIDVEDLINR